MFRGVFSLGRFPALACASACAFTGIYSTNIVYAAAPEPKVFKSCQVIGDGFKSEIWKARHANIQILELEHPTVQMLMTKLRDVSIEGPEFTFYADRLLNFLIEQAIAELPTEETVVSTTDGDQYEGLQFAEGMQKMCGITVSGDAKVMSPALSRLLPGLELGFVVTSQIKGKRSIHLSQFPEDVKDRFILILDPVIRRGDSVDLSIQLLKGYGVPEDRIVVITITMSPQAADKLKAYKDLKIVSASIEAGIIEETGKLIPGIGNFEQRYESGRAKPE